MRDVKSESKTNPDTIVLVSLSNLVTLTARSEGLEKRKYMKNIVYTMQIASHAPVIFHFDFGYTRYPKEYNQKMLVIVTSP